eukprot:COSAG01_NODE_36765_length_512_cov_17.479419_1_plen_50_part_10
MPPPGLRFPCCVWSGCHAVTGRVGAAAYLPPTAARQPGEDACTTGESAVS